MFQVYASLRVHIPCKDIYLEIGITLRHAQVCTRLDAEFVVGKLDS